MGDDEPCKIVGMGKVRIKLNNGNEWVLKDVRNIPTIKINLTSTRQLGDSGCVSIFGKMWWKITKGALVIEKGDMIGTLYVCPHNTDYSITVDSIETSVALWHHRLDDMGDKGMHIIHSRKLLLDLK